MRQVPIVVTAYTGGENSAEKLHMTEKMCEALSKTGNYICLATHSTIPESIQKYCNAFIYDSDNTFHVNGEPKEGQNHGIAETRSIHNALNHLDRLGYKEFLKIGFDADPRLPFNTIIERAQYFIDNQNKSLVCSGYGNNETVGTLIFYSTFDFYRRVFSLEDPNKLKTCFEVSVYNNIKELQLVDEVYMCHIRQREDFLGFEIIDYSHDGGSYVDEYPY